MVPVLLEVVQVCWESVWSELVSDSLILSFINISGGHSHDQLVNLHVLTNVS